MNKQEFMAMSLPYGLKIKSQHQIFTLHYYKDSVEIINDYDHISIGNLIQENEDKENKTEPHKPILRPLSDLIKPCLDGELIPMVELAKICDSVNGYWKLKQEENISAIRYIDSDGITTVLAYHWETQSFGANSCIDNHFEKFINVHRQLDMFQKLVEWHFDICGLIDKGEAVDYSTLKGFVF